MSISNEALAQRFVKFLKDNKVYDCFVKNVASSPRKMTLEQFLDAATPTQYISGAFSWDMNPYNDLGPMNSTGSWARLSNNWRILHDSITYKQLKPSDG